MIVVVSGIFLFYRRFWVVRDFLNNFCEQFCVGFDLCWNVGLMFFIATFLGVFSSINGIFPAKSNIL